MSSDSSEQVEINIECLRRDNTAAARRVSFLLDQNGEVFVQVFGEPYNDRREELIMENKVKLTYSRDQCDKARLHELKDELEKLTKTKEEIKEWLSPQSNNGSNNGGVVVSSAREETHQRAGLILHDGNFQPWFFGKITRRESESVLKDKEPGTFLIRLSEKTASCYTLSIRNNNSNSHGCRHFLIITDSNEYKLLGSYQSFGTLTSLIHHHGHAPITKLGNEVLLEPCPKPANFKMII